MERPSSRAPGYRILTAIASKRQTDVGRFSKFDIDPGRQHHDAGAFSVRCSSTKTDGGVSDGDGATRGATNCRGVAGAQKAGGEKASCCAFRCNRAASAYTTIAR